MFVALIMTIGRTIANPVNKTDVFATILDSAGFDLTTLLGDRSYDFVSFLTACSGGWTCP